MGGGVPGWRNGGIGQFFEAENEINSPKIIGGNEMEVFNRSGMRKRKSVRGGIAECATLENPPQMYVLGIQAKTIDRRRIKKSICYVADDPMDGVIKRFWDVWTKFLVIMTSFGRNGPLGVIFSRETETPPCVGTKFELN